MTEALNQLARADVRWIHFLPWQGSAFPEKADRRLLVLGESHYSDAPEDEDFTRSVVRQYVSGAENRAFLTNIAQAITGKPHWEIDRLEFWNSVAFYNYVQETVIEGRRPTVKMFRDSEAAFFEVIDLLRPSHVLALGTRLWECMPPLQNEKLNFECGGQRHQYGEYRRAAECILAMHIVHPSSGGFSSREWYPVIQKFLEMKARQDEKKLVLG
jgi:hypothetical protein